MTQTNRNPVGFLDLIGAETGGKNPPQYADAVVPGANLTELYLTETLGSMNSTVLVNAEGVIEAFRVPNDQAWLLRGACAFYTTTNAADAVRVTLRVRYTPRQQAAGDFPSIWTSRLLAPGAIGLRATDSWANPSPFVCAPGVSLDFIAEENAGANKNVRLQLLINRLYVGARP